MRSICSDPACGVSPAEKLSPDQLNLLRNAFTGAREQTCEKSLCRKNARNRRGDEKQGMEFDEFRDVLRSVIGPDIEDMWVEKFFMEVRRNKSEIKTCIMSYCIERKASLACCETTVTQVDISCTGQVTWDQLCSHLLLEYTERERASIPRAALLDLQPQIRHCPHNKVGWYQK